MRFLPAAITYRGEAWWRQQQGQRLTGSRHQREGRPTFKWERVLVETVGLTWQDAAMDEKRWKQLKGELISKAYRLLNVVELEQRYPERKRHAQGEEFHKKRRVVREAPERWNLRMQCQFQLL
eukprot:1904414-Karenia_brevis.AAC.1